VKQCDVVLFLLTESFHPKSNGQLGKDLSEEEIAKMNEDQRMMLERLRNEASEYKRR